MCSLLLVCAVLKILHLDKHILNEEDCTSIGKAGVWWYNDIAVVLAVKPPGVLQKTLGVFDEYKGQWWCEIAVKGIKSKLSSRTHHLSTV